MTQQWVKQHPGLQNHYPRILQSTRLSAITTSWFTTLRGRPATEVEQRNALLLGAMTPLYDDLMDEHAMTHDEILISREMSNPALHTVHSILDDLHANVPDKTLFDRILKQSGKAQDDSLMQVRPKILSPEKLVSITAEKGAAFTLLYRVILDHFLSLKEERAICTLGFLLQLTNDFFDVYKDLKNGQQTLLTIDDNLNIVHTLWTEKLDLFHAQWYHLPYAEKAIYQSLNEIAIILGRGQIALDRLVQLAATPDGPYRPREYSRQQLICDMERPAHLYASLVWANAFCSK